MRIDSVVDIVLLLISLNFFLDCFFFFHLKISCSFLLVRGLLHWSGLYRSVPACINTRRLCREFDVVSARAIYSPSYCKKKQNISQWKHIAAAVDVTVCLYVSFGWFDLYCFCCCYHAHMYWSETCKWERNNCRQQQPTNIYPL